MMFSIYGGDLIYCKQKLLVKNRRFMLNVFNLKIFYFILTFYCASKFIV